jgi:hypothetical protein
MLYDSSKNNKLHDYRQNYLAIGSLQKAIRFIEIIDPKLDRIQLRSCFNRWKARHRYELKSNIDQGDPIINLLVSFISVISYFHSLNFKSKYTLPLEILLNRNILTNTQALMTHLRNK